MPAMLNPFGIDCHILKDLASSDVSRSNREKKESGWGPRPRGWPPPSPNRQLLHHTPNVLINPISEVPRLADVAIRRAV